MKAWFTAQWAKFKAWWAPKWAKLKPGVIALGAVLLGILALIGLSKRSRKAPDEKAGDGDGNAPKADPSPGGGTAREEKAKEDAREKTLSADPDSIVDGLDERARGGIDAAREAGERAGRDAAREALHGSGDAGGG